MPSLAKPVLCCSYSYAHTKPYKATRGLKSVENLRLIRKSKIHGDGVTV